MPVSVAMGDSLVAGMILAHPPAARGGTHGQARCEDARPGPAAGTTGETSATWPGPPATCRSGSRSFLALTIYILDQGVLCVVHQSAAIVTLLRPTSNLTYRCPS